MLRGAPAPHRRRARRRRRPHETGRPGPNAEIYSVNPDAGYAVAIVGARRRAVPARALCDLRGACSGPGSPSRSTSPATDPVTAVTGTIDALAPRPASAGPGRARPARRRRLLRPRHRRHPPRRRARLGPPRPASTTSPRRSALPVGGRQRRQPRRRRRTRATACAPATRRVRAAVARPGRSRPRHRPRRRRCCAAPAAAPARSATCRCARRRPAAGLPGPGQRRGRAARPYGAADSPAGRRRCTDAAAPCLRRSWPTRIALGLAAVVAVLDPPLVVLAGEVAQAGGAALGDGGREGAVAGRAAGDARSRSAPSSDDAVPARRR